MKPKLLMNRGIKLKTDNFSEQEHSYRILIDNIPDIIYALDNNERITVISQSGCKALGLSKSEILGKNHRELGFPEKVLTEWHELHSRVLTLGVTVTTETSTPMPDGNLKTYEVILKPIFTDGKITGIAGSGRDVTNRVLAEKQLQDTVGQCRKLVDLSPVAIVVEQEGRIINANAAAAVIFNVKTANSLFGKCIADFLHANYSEDFDEKVQLAVTSGKPVEGELVRKDGESVQVEITASDSECNCKRSLKIALRNITESKKKEKEFLQATKLESIGVLAGGIAHDYNNILTILLGNLSLAKIQTSNPKQVLLNDIEDAALQAKDLTKQLLTFSKECDPVKEKINLRDILEKNVALALSGLSVGFECSIQPDLMRVEIDTGQICQVINNILINAVQAMPNGGTIRVKAENVSVESGELSLTLKQGNYVKITIADEGIGIPNQIVERMFDPFFTTKEKGSGLGLSISFSIIKKHDGHIEVNTEIGVGSTFKIYLPAISDSEKDINEQKPDYTSSGRILVMEDDYRIKKVMSEMLSHLGYETDFANDGAVAISLYKRTKKLGFTYNAVILDLTIRGGMGGRETIKELLMIDPEVSAVISSGYSNDPVVLNYNEFGFIGYILKPFQLEDLKNVLSKVKALSLDLQL